MDGGKALAAAITLIVIFVIVFSVALIMSRDVDKDDRDDEL